MKSDRRRRKLERVRKPLFHWVQPGFIIFWGTMVCLTVTAATVQSFRSKTCLMKVEQAAEGAVTTDEMESVHENGLPNGVYGLDLDDSIYIWGNL